MTVAMTAATSEAWRCGLPRVQTSNRLNRCDKLKEKKSKNLQDLEKMIQEEWKKISVLDINRLSLIACIGELQLLLSSRAGTRNVNICREFIIIV